VSDTPRTDGMEPCEPPYNGVPGLHVPKAFARQLERELRDTQAQLGAAQHELDVWQCMACSLAERLRMFGLCIPPEEPFGWRELLAEFEKLKGVKP